jgi:hypothetical protein
MCGCWPCNSKDSACVFEVAVKMNTVQQSFHPFRSLRLTQFLSFNFDSGVSTWSSDIARRLAAAIHIRVNMIVDHVNSHGGWTAVAWFPNVALSDFINESLPPGSPHNYAILALLLPTELSQRNKYDYYLGTKLIPNDPADASDINFRNLHKLAPPVVASLQHLSGRRRKRSDDDESKNSNNDNTSNDNDGNTKSDD